MKHKKLLGRVENERRGKYRAAAQTDRETMKKKKKKEDKIGEKKRTQKAGLKLSSAQNFIYSLRKPIYTPHNIKNSFGKM